MRTVAALVVVLHSSLALAEAPSAIGADGEPEPEWVCAPSGVEAARIASLDAPVRSIVASKLDALILEPSDVPYVVIEGDTNAVAQIAAELRDGALEIAHRGCTASKSPLRVIVGVAAIEDLEVSRVARVRSRGAIATARDAVVEIDGATASELELRGEWVGVFTSGGGFHRMLVDAETLVAHQSGAGVLRLSGKAGAASLGQDGAGYLVASELDATDVVIDRSGHGEVHVATTRQAYAR